MIEKGSPPSGTLPFEPQRPDAAVTEALSRLQHAKDELLFLHESSLAPGYPDSIDTSTKPAIEQKSGNLAWRPSWSKRGPVDASDLKKENDGISTSPTEVDEEPKSTPESTTSESCPTKMDSLGQKRYSPISFNRQFVRLSDSFHSMDGFASPIIHTPSSPPYNAVPIWDKVHESQLRNSTPPPQPELSPPDLQIELAKAISTRPRFATLRDMTSDPALQASCKMSIAHVDALYELNRKYFGLWDMKQFPHLMKPIMEEYRRYTTKLMELEDSLRVPELQKESEFWHGSENEPSSVAMASTYRVKMEPHPRPEPGTWKPVGIRTSDNDGSYERLESHMLEGKLFNFPKNERKDGGDGEDEGSDGIDGNGLVKDKVIKLDE